ncbi:MAG: DAK2 domain-containing protein [Actinomycetota bacterium]|jgi:hypothetical protein|nr:DAK2 domain-containing protein [Actinomycetota bacterium]MDA8279111.1 DAK2 domain-containing protein [Actinomycetota bacterium]
MKALATLRATDLADAVRVYRTALREHQAAINSLNVYPVPDGDTGTNMALTLESVVAEIDGISGPPVMGEVCRAVAHGSLMGARGNSGVILSQLLRGLVGELAAYEEVDGPVLARALRAASIAADGAVLRPVEGTILSVARAAARGAVALIGETVPGLAGSEGSAGNGPPHAGSSGTVDSAAGVQGLPPSLVDVASAARSAAAEALDRTPQQLAVLARAGVVDAGGAGLVVLFDSLLNVVDGRPVATPPRAPHAVVGEDALAALGADGEHAEDRSGVDDLRYEVMYLLEAEDATIPAFKEVWAGLGDSIVVVGGDGLWNCHIHTDEVGPAIEAALDAGRPRDIRVTDLHEQVEEVRWVREGAALEPADEPTGPPPRTAVVAVANGDGIARIFRSLGVHHFVPGGQSMNPSTAQILEVVESLPSPEVILLPNNDNIRPVALQVGELAGRPVRVVPTGSIVEGFAALLEYDPEASADDNAAVMTESARRVVAGEVVRAVRDAEGPDGPLRAGDWMGLSRQGIEVVGTSLAEAACALVAKLLQSGHELVTLIEGEGATAGDTRRITEWLAEQRPDVAIEVHHGGQPLYPYLVSIE